MFPYPGDDVRRDRVLAVAGHVHCRRARTGPACRTASTSGSRRRSRFAPRIDSRRRTTCSRRSRARSSRRPCATRPWPSTSTSTVSHEGWPSAVWKAIGADRGARRRCSSRSTRASSNNARRARSATRRGRRARRSHARRPARARAADDPIGHPSAARGSAHDDLASARRRRSASRLRAAAAPRAVPEVERSRSQRRVAGTEGFGSRE